MFLQVTSSPHYWLAGYHCPSPHSDTIPILEMEARRRWKSLSIYPKETNASKVPF